MPRRSAFSFNGGESEATQTFRVFA